MTLIADAKAAFDQAIESELDDIGAEIHRLAARARDCAHDARGLNDLAASFNGIASTLEHAATQVEDARAECRTWLGVGREPIHQYVSPTVGSDTTAAKVPFTYTNNGRAA